MTDLNKAESRLLMAAILLISLNLRPAIAAIGQLTELLVAETSLGSTGIGLLTMLPVLVMGDAAITSTCRSSNRTRLRGGSTRSVGSMGSLLVPVI
jgi:cyanate permease